MRPPGTTARDDRPPARAPDRDAAVDCDVALVGGGLSLLYAPVLAAMGAKVHVFDRSRAGGTHRELKLGEARDADRGGVVVAALFAAQREQLLANRRERVVLRQRRNGQLTLLSWK